MTKTELTNAVAENTGLTKKEADAAIMATFGAIAGALKNGEKVQIPGFGIFEVKERAARTGRNPQTGEAMQISASRTVGYKSSNTLKEEMNP